MFAGFKQFNLGFFVEKKKATEIRSNGLKVIMLIHFALKVIWREAESKNISYMKFYSQKNMRQ